MLAVMMGGQAAEEIIFGDITTGASNDLQNASGVARKMVTEYGMSEKLGPQTFDNGQNTVFLGKELTQGHSYSDAVAEKIDSETSAILRKAQQTAKKIIQENRAKLTLLAKKLIVEETVEGPELLGILNGTSEDAPVAA
jgi:cell division protease FtsH